MTWMVPLADNTHLQIKDIASRHLQVGVLCTLYVDDSGLVWNDSDMLRDVVEPTNKY